MIRYKFTFSIGYANAIQKDIFFTGDMGYTDEQWEKLSEEKKENILQQTWLEWKENFIDGGWQKI